MSNTEEHGAETFFRQQRAALAHTLATAGSEATLMQAWDSFEGNVAIQCEGQPPVACGKGCASCCALRVTALAPDVFVLADCLRCRAAQSRRRRPKHGDGENGCGLARSG